MIQRPKCLHGLVLGILMALLVFSTAGCASAPGASDSGQIVLKFVYLDELSGNYTALASKFHQQYPNITVNLTPIPAFSGDPKLNFNTQIQDADAFRAPINLIDEPVANLLLPLDALINTDATYPKSDQFPNAVAALRLKNQQMGIPAGIEPYVIFYVPQKLADAKINVPNPNWTIDQFTKTALSVQNLKDPSHFTYGFCSHPIVGSDDLLLFAHLFGGGLTVGPLVENAPLVLNQPANISALAWYADLKRKGDMLPDIVNYSGMLQSISEQHCGFWIDTLNRRRFGGETVYGSKNVQPQVAMLPLPGYKNQYNLVQVDSYSILAASKHSQAAWQWLSYLASQSTASGKLIPPLKSQALSKDLNSPQRLAIAQQLRDDDEWTSLWMLRDARLGKAYDIIAQAALDVLNGNANAQTALDNAQRSIQ